ncbi:MAG: protein translocase subunit SecD, partial [Anaerolineae bacterium]|nr:protein translocase subunit SecD [Anaerolineae bacterium]
MQSRNSVVLGLIIFLALVALYIVAPIQHWSGLTALLVWQPPEARSLDFKLGLDLRGGTQVLLQARQVAGQHFTAADMEAARVIVERRVNALGLTEPLVQLQGENRIIVEMPGVSNPDQAVQTLKNTGQLEFVEMGSSTNSPYPRIQQGVYVRTTGNDRTPTAEELGKTEFPYPDVVFKTIMTGRDLKNATVTLDQYGAPAIAFELTDNGAKIFAEYTSQHIGDILAIVLDNVVLSAPRIQSAIPEGRGEITGKFTRAEAESLAVQMRYGALPVPLDVVNRRTIGATLGTDSVQASIRAGLIGLFTVLLFMIVYYRLPGLMAAFALLIYALLNLAPVSYT